MKSILFIYCIYFITGVMCVFFCRYQEWMKSPELQLLTASDPLSLDEEYEMQKSWLMDEDSEYIT